MQDYLPWNTFHLLPPTARNHPDRLPYHNLFIVTGPNHRLALFINGLAADLLNIPIALFIDRLANCVGNRDLSLGNHLAVDHMALFHHLLLINGPTGGVRNRYGVSLPNGLLHGVNPVLVHIFVNRATRNGPDRNLHGGIHRFPYLVTLLANMLFIDGPTGYIVDRNDLFLPNGFTNGTPNLLDLLFIGGLKDSKVSDFVPLFDNGFANDGADLANAKLGDRFAHGNRFFTKNGPVYGLIAGFFDLLGYHFVANPMLDFRKATLLFGHTSS